MARYVVIPERSCVWADARSSLHPIHVETPGFEGQIEADVVDGEVRLGVPTHIELEVVRLESHSGLIDTDLQRRLEARKYRHIKGDLREATPIGDARLRLTGDLTLHGVSRPLTVEVTARVSADGLVEVEGEKVIDMREFGLTPPKFLMFKVEPTVKVRARLIARRQT